MLQVGKAFQTGSYTIIIADPARYTIADLARRSHRSLQLMSPAARTPYIEATLAEMIGAFAEGAERLGAFAEGLDFGKKTHRKQFVGEAVKLICESKAGHGTIDSNASGPPADRRPPKGGRQVGGSEASAQPAFEPEGAMVLRVTRANREATQWETSVGPLRYATIRREEPPSPTASFATIQAFKEANYTLGDNDRKALALTFELTALRRIDFRTPNQPVTLMRGLPMLVDDRRDRLESRRVEFSHQGQMPHALTWPDDTYMAGMIQPELPGSIPWSVLVYLRDEPGVFLVAPKGTTAGVGERFTLTYVYYLPNSSPLSQDKEKLTLKLPGFMSVMLDVPPWSWRTPPTPSQFAGPQPAPPPGD